MKKNCSHCKEEKELALFSKGNCKSGKQSWCKLCISERDKGNQKLKEYKCKYHLKNKEKHNKANLDRYWKDRTPAVYMTKDEQIERTKVLHKRWYQKHKEEVKARSKAKYYSVKGTGTYNKYVASKTKKRITKDSGYHITLMLRSRLRNALNASKVIKKTKTIDLLGCTVSELKQHLQKTAVVNGYNDFDIETYDTKEYHIDHVKPCKSFNLKNETEQKRCFNFSNLQILTAEANMTKGAILINNHV